MGQTVDATRPRLDVLAFVAGFLALMGYQFGAEQLYALARVDAVAVNTSVLLMLLAVAGLADSPRSLVAQMLDGRDPSAVLLRRMVPVALILLPALAFADQRLGDAGWYGVRFGVALIVCCGAALVIVATVIAGRDLDAASVRELQAKRDLERLNASLVQGRDVEWARAEALSASLAQERSDFSRILESIDETVWSGRVTESGLDVRYSGSPSPRLFGGQPPADLNALTALGQMLHPDDQPVLDGFRARVLADQSADIEVRVVGFDGVERWAWMRGTPRPVDGGTVFDGIISDITERRAVAELRDKALQLETARVEELRELTRLREDFVAVAGHELRSPLTVIIGNAELLQGDVELSDEQRQRMRVIVTRAHQVAELINDFFELTRLEAGMAELHLAPIDLGASAQEAVDSYRPTATSAGLTLACEAWPIQVCADEQSLRRVLDHLLSNAVKYTPSGGCVTVAVRSLGQFATLEVSDTGIGIPPEEQPKVFDHLYRASSARANRIAGTGIGLAVAKALVEAQGGTIAVFSRPEGGTIFRVALPTVEPVVLAVSAAVGTRRA